jgi:hypothetical protein
MMTRTADNQWVSMRLLLERQNLPQALSRMREILFLAVIAG